MSAFSTNNAATVATPSNLADMSRNNGSRKNKKSVAMEGEGDREVGAAEVEASEAGSSLPFLFLVSTSAIVLIVSLLIAIYLSYNA